MECITHSGRSIQFSLLADCRSEEKKKSKRRKSSVDKQKDEENKPTQPNNNRENKTYNIINEFYKHLYMCGANIILIGWIFRERNDPKQWVLFFQISPQLLTTAPRSWLNILSRLLLTEKCACIWYVSFVSSNFVSFANWVKWRAKLNQLNGRKRREPEQKERKGANRSRPNQANHIANILSFQHIHSSCSRQWIHTLFILSPSSIWVVSSPQPPPLESPFQFVNSIPQSQCLSSASRMLRF